MITEFADKFLSYYSYQYISKGLIEGFEKYLVENNKQMGDVYDAISDYTETLPIANKTRRNYNQKLRNFIRYVYNEEGIVYEHDARTIFRVKK